MTERELLPEGWRVALAEMNAEAEELHVKLERSRQRGRSLRRIVKELRGRLSDRRSRR